MESIESPTNQPQLRMILRPLKLPPERELPATFSLRTAEARDRNPIARVLTSSFLEPWDAERVEGELLNHPDVLTTFVIEYEALIVATASYQIKPTEFPNCGWVHWVGAEPVMSGKGLGYIVCRAVLEEAMRHGNDRARLLTNDHRLPAIATYLKLGFVPDPYHESHPAQWAGVKEKLR